MEFYVIMQVRSYHRRKDAKFAINLEDIDLNEDAEVSEIMQTYAECRPSGKTITSTNKKIRHPNLHS